jgi:hypothetical protein
MKTLESKPVTDKKNSGGSNDKEPIYQKKT